MLPGNSGPFAAIYEPGNTHPTYRPRTHRCQHGGFNSLFLLSPSGPPTCTCTCPTCQGPVTAVLQPPRTVYPHIYLRIPLDLLCNLFPWVRLGSPVSESAADAFSHVCSCLKLSLFLFCLSKAEWLHLGLSELQTPCSLKKKNPELKGEKDTFIWLRLRVPCPDRCDQSPEV